MAYFFSPEIFMSAFPVPVGVVDKYIKLAGATQLKVLLFLLRHQSEGINPEKAAEELGVSAEEAEEAVEFWVNAGVILRQGEDLKPAAAPEKKAPAKAVRPRSQKPTREEVARRGLEDSNVAFLLREAEIKFGKVLSANESSTIVWLYDDEGMSPAVILMLLEFAVAEKSCKVSFIERTALKWIEKGVSNIAEAEEEIRELQQSRSAWRVVERALGIERRLPSSNELELARLWVIEWGYGADILHAVYEICVDTLSKFSMSFVKRRLETWHENGVKNLADIGNFEKKKPAKKGKKSNENINTTDMDWAEKMLQTGGNE